MSENRLHQRKRYLRPVDYAAGGRLFQSATEDISASGMFIRTSEDLPVGTEIMACFEVSGERLKTKAVVVRKNSQGMGVVFLHDYIGKEQVLCDLIGKISMPSDAKK